MNTAKVNRHTDLLKHSAAVLICLWLMFVLLPGCAQDEKKRNPTFTVRLVALKGSPEPSELDNPVEMVRKLVLGLTGQNPDIESLGEQTYRFEIEGKLIPPATTRIQTPVVKVGIYGAARHVADNQPVPDYAELVVSHKHMKSIYLEENRLGRPYFVFEFTREGQNRFEEYTTNNVGNFIMISMEGRVVNWLPISGPVLGSTGLIEGRFRKDHAERYLWGIRQAMYGYRLEILSGDGSESSE